MLGNPQEGPVRKLPLREGQYVGGGLSGGTRKRSSEGGPVRCTSKRDGMWLIR